jgi:ribosomal-protein-alanine N-acetyltransferase
MAHMSLPTPTLQTARLRLRPVTSADADALFALHSSAYVLRYWDAPPWSERARAETFIAASQQLAEEGSGARLAIDRTSDGAFIGWCSLTRWNPDYRSASMGYCLDAAAWGHGYATEAARALLQWAFDTLDLNRVQAETDTRNVASARVLEKLGFVREGALREDCVVNGDVSDSWVYGLLRREWRPSSGAGAKLDEDGDGAGLVAARLVESQELPVGVEDGRQAGDRELQRPAEPDVRGRSLVELQGRERRARSRGERHHREVGGELVEGVRIGDAERADRCTAQRRQVPADTEGGAEVASESSHVGAAGAPHRDVQVEALRARPHLVHGELVDGDPAGFEGDLLPCPDPGIGTSAVDLDRRDGGRDLVQLADQLGRSGPDRRLVEA